jgi:hypothetical protein
MVVFLSCFGLEVLGVSDELAGLVADIQPRLVENVLMQIAEIYA